MALSLPGPAAESYAAYRATAHIMGLDLSVSSWQLNMLSPMLFRVCLLLGSLSIAGCENPPARWTDARPSPGRSAPDDARRHYENDSLWIDNHIAGAPSIRLALGE